LAKSFKNTRIFTRVYHTDCEGNDYLCGITFIWCLTVDLQVTPKTKSSRKSEKAFFTLPEYEQWKKENNNGEGYVIKYYKVGAELTDTSSWCFYELSIDTVNRVWVLPQTMMLKSTFPTWVFIANPSSQ
jgi:hypothetical protein